MSSLKHVESIYFIGIGGIGMSALARYFNKNNKLVSGYDKTETTLTKKLVSEGIDIHYKDDISFIPKGVDLVIYTPAVPEDLQELVYLRSLEIPVEKRSKILGLISNDQFSIAVAGTHGKTTTSGILAHVLKSSKIDVSAFLGGVLAGYETNNFIGASNIVVLEADEFDRSFLHLRPSVTVLNSVDPDHLDIYGSHENMLQSFRQFIQLTKKDGLVLLSEGTIETLGSKYLEEIKAGYNVVVFGFEEKCDVVATIIKRREGRSYFRVKGLDYPDIIFDVKMAGRHNVSNALVSIITGHALGVEGEDVKNGLNGFKGIKRRFEWIFEGSQIYIDDYAHHPSEIEAVEEAVRSMYPRKKIWVIFQPHLFSRTFDFAEGFAKALDKFDKILLMDIYPARELPIEGVTTELIKKYMKNDNAQIMIEKEILDEIARKDFDVLMTLGAGDIDLLVPKIKNILMK